jgi:iron(III) transport system substrate-binding protein
MPDLFASSRAALGTGVMMDLVASIRKLALFAAVAVTAAPATAQVAAPVETAAAMQFLAGLPAQQRLAVLEREARREGGFTIYGALGIDRAQILNRMFNDRYPDVKVNFVRLTEAELADKVLLESRTGRVNSDLALSTVAWMGLLAPALAPYEPTSWNDFDPRFRLGSIKDGWTAIVYESLPTTIAWRTDRVKREEAPKTLWQVADPKWAGRIGTTSHLENMMNGLIGALGEPQAMDLLKKLSANRPRLYNSTAALSQGIASGEFDIAFDFSAHRPTLLKKEGAPVDFVLQDPLFATGITFSVVKGAKNPYAAALYMDYLTQARQQELLDKAEGGRLFGNTKGTYDLKLSDYPKLRAYAPISPERFKELNRIAEDLFIRK